MKKIILSIFCLFILNKTALALVEVDITRGNLDPLPIAVSPLYVEPGSLEIKYEGKTIREGRGDSSIGGEKVSGEGPNRPVQTESDGTSFIKRIEIFGS